MVQNSSNVSDNVLAPLLLGVKIDTLVDGNVEVGELRVVVHARHVVLPIHAVGVDEVLGPSDELLNEEGLRDLAHRVGCTLLPRARQYILELVRIVDAKGTHAARAFLRLDDERVVPGPRVLPQRVGIGVGKLEPQMRGERKALGRELPMHLRL